MDYSIQIMEEQKFIHVTSMGTWDKEKDNQLIQDIFKSIATTGIKKILLDMRGLQFDFQLFTIFQRAQELQEQRVEAHAFSLKVALVYAPVSEKIKDDFRFFETTAQNRGLPYRAFEQMETALEWLLS
ncbi:MAG: hypothetical protein QM730_01170 [Anaerolineales bacterium]